MSVDYFLRRQAIRLFIRRARVTYGQRKGEACRALQRAMIRTADTAKHVVPYEPKWFAGIAAQDMRAPQLFVNAAVWLGIVWTPALTGQRHDLLYACPGHSNPLKQPGKKFFALSFRLLPTGKALPAVETTAMGTTDFLQRFSHHVRRHLLDAGAFPGFGKRRSDSCRLLTPFSRIPTSKYLINCGTFQLRVCPTKSVYAAITGEHRVFQFTGRHGSAVCARTPFPCAASRTAAWRSAPRS